MAKILLVDDSETVRKQLKNDLTPAGHEVLEASDGSLGLELLKVTAGIQLILCDVNMPNMDGLTMCTKLRAIPGYEKTPVFMLTTESGTDMKAKGKEAGVVAWVTKPYVAAKLLQVIDMVMKKMAAAAPPAAA